MIFFYKNYSEYSKLATFFSMMGGMFYAFGIMVVIIGAGDESLGIGGGLIMAAIFAVIGFCNNAQAKSIAKSKGAPIGEQENVSKKNEDSFEKGVVNKDEVIAEPENKVDLVSVESVNKSEDVLDQNVVNRSEVTAEPEAVLVGGIQESFESWENLKKKEQYQDSVKTSGTEWKCIYCGTSNSGKFCCECGKARVVAKFCPNCGSKLREGQKFCSNCGTKIGL